MSNTVEILVPIFSAQFFLLVGVIGYIYKKQGTQDVALALLIQQVNPPGEPSLRSMLHDIQTQQQLAAVEATAVARALQARQTQGDGHS